LAAADGLTLAAPLATLTDLPAFPTSSVDGYAVRGAGPWRVIGRALAGSVPPPLGSGEAMEIATGAMVPAGTDEIIRVEDSTIDADGRVDGRARPQRDWRDQGDEAPAGEELLPAGTPITPGVLGLAAACGYDNLTVTPPPRATLVVFGDELLTEGTAGLGRVRDSLGPQVPGWLSRLGARVTTEGVLATGPVTDTLAAHIDALKQALAGADLVCTTGGTMHGPVDHLHPALEALGATYLADSVAVRPGFPMLLASVPRPDGRPAFVAGLPGNPQSAIVALVSLVMPLLRGLNGQRPGTLPLVTLAEPIGGRGDFTHLALVRLDDDGRARPLAHSASAMLRGLARADGFAVIAPGTEGTPGTRVPLLPLPIFPGQRP